VNQKERVKKLLLIYSKKIKKFKRRHISYLNCFPSGRKIGKVKIDGVERHVYVCSSFKRDIYLCRSKCPKGCVDFEMKIYLCADLRCPKKTDCLSLSRKKRKKICKKLNLYKERKRLDETYEKYFLLMQVFRGLKINSQKTLNWLDKRKRRNGKISSVESKKESERKGKIRKKKIKRSIKGKRVN